MNEYPIAITSLNDYIFCPVSIYFHSVDNDDSILMQDSFQLNGTYAHQKSDTATYSSKRNVLQGTGIYCEKYNLYGRIDTFDIDKGILTERKKKIKNIYDGYVFQLYAQYFALVEMGYNVKELRLYSMDDNKTYIIPKPDADTLMFDKFEKLILEINTFSFDGFKQGNISKCENCIYEPLCSFSLLKGDVKSVYRT